MIRGTPDVIRGTPDVIRGTPAVAPLQSHVHPPRDTMTWTCGCQFPISPAVWTTATIPPACDSHNTFYVIKKSGEGLIWADALQCERGTTPTAYEP